MKLNEIPLIGGFYKDEDRDWSVQDCVNYLPTVAETTGTRTQTMLRTAPGLRPFVRIDGAGPCRGVYNCEGRLFAVLGQQLYLIDANGYATPIGKIPGVQRVQFSHNQATSSGQNQLVIGNGQAGYIYNTQTKEFKRITDEGFIGGISPTFVDSYIVWVSTNRLYMLNSSVADADEYNTLDQFQSEYSPDKLVCTIASSSELVAMSERSIEFFQNTGANEQPFRSKGISIDLGAASRWGAVICDFSLFFLASDGTFRRIDNYNATRISTGPVEQAIRDLDWTQAQAYVWEEGRYKVVYWTFPDGYTFGWDIANGMWHRRVSYGLDRWRVSSTTRWNGKTIAGDFQRGDLWSVDSNYFLEGDQEYNCEITGPYIHGDGNLVKMPRMDLIMQTGQGPDQIPGQFPVQPGALKLTGSLPNLVMGTAIDAFKYIASDGIPPYGPIVLESGSLPVGLTLQTDGTVTGTPTVAGDYSWSVSITDSNGGKAINANSVMVVDNSQTISVAPIVSFIQGVNGGGAANRSSEYARDAPLDSPTVAAVGGWAALLVRSIADDLPPLGNIPADSRIFIYKQPSPSGETFLDPGWHGDPSHQSAMDARLVEDGRAQYIGPITDAPAVGTARRYLTTFIYPDGLSTQYSSRMVLYNFGTRVDTAVFLQYANPASLPAGSTVIPDLPGYYMAPSGDIYRVNWNMNP